MTPIDSWRVRAPGVAALACRRADPVRRFDVLLGLGLVVAELSWVALLVWVLSLVF